MPVTPAPISVAMPCYNAERYIREALQSIVDQTLPVSEVVIVNDGSTDGTLTVIEEFSRRHPGLIRVITQPNQGPGVARTSAVRAAAHNDLVTFDTDDLLHPEAVEAWYAHACRNPRYALVYGCYSLIDAESRVTGQVITHEYRKDPLEGAILPTMLWENVVSATCFVRRDKVLEVGGYYDEQHLPQRNGAEDALCYFRLLLAGYEFGYVPRPLFSYRDHAHGISKTPNRARESLKAVHALLFQTEPKKMAEAYAVARKWREDDVRLGQCALAGRDQLLVGLQAKLERGGAAREKLRRRLDSQTRRLLSLERSLEAAKAASATADGRSRLKRFLRRIAGM